MHEFLGICYRMRYVAAYLLAALGGKETPSTGDIKKILDSVGIESDDTRMSKVNLCMSTQEHGVLKRLSIYLSFVCFLILTFVFVGCV